MGILNGTGVDLLRVDLRVVETNRVQGGGIATS